MFCMMSNYKNQRGKVGCILKNQARELSDLYTANCSADFINLETVPFKGQFTFRLIS